MGTEVRMRATVINNYVPVFFKCDNFGKECYFFIR